MALAACDDLDALLARAAALRDRGHGARISYSRKVFIPLTQLCRDVCHYCTFAHPPRRGEAAYLTPDEVLAIARAGAAAGCNEALFTLGDKPELRYRAAREELARLGHDTHARLSRSDGRAGAARDRPPAAPQSRRHDGRRDRAAARRVGVAGHHAGERLRAAVARAAGRISARPTSIPPCGSRRSRAAGEAAVPFTSGILIGIGETRAERIEALLALRDLHRALRPHPGDHRPELPRQAGHAHGRRAGARRSTSICGRSRSRAILFGPEMNIQAPPNLQRRTRCDDLIAAGINDWGGVSPVTPDHVNPEAPVAAARRARARDRGGRQDAGRSASRSIRPMRRTRRAGSIRQLRTAVLRASDARRLRARRRPGRPGADVALAGAMPRDRAPRRAALARRRILDRACARTRTLGEDDIVALFAARGDEFPRGLRGRRRAARARRSATRSPTSSPATSTTPTSATTAASSAPSPRASSARTCAARPTISTLDEIQRRVPRSLGARRHRSLPAGRHPSRLHRRDLSRDLPRHQGGAARHARPRLLAARGLAGRGDARHAGRGLPRRAARRRASARCPAPPPRSSTTRCAPSSAPTRSTPRSGSRSCETAHRARPAHHRHDHVRPCRHAASTGRGICCVCASCRQRTGGFTEFVPLPFVPMEAPIYLQGRARAPGRPSARRC